MDMIPQIWYTNNMQSLSTLSTLDPNKLHTCSEQERQDIYNWQKYLNIPVIERLWMPYTDTPQDFTQLSWETYSQIKKVLGLHLSLEPASYDNVPKMLLFFDGISQKKQKEYLPLVRKYIEHQLSHNSVTKLSALGLILADSPQVLRWLKDKVLLSFSGANKKAVIGVEAGFHLRYYDIHPYAKHYSYCFFHHEYSKVYPYTSLLDPVLLDDIQKYGRLISIESVYDAADNCQIGQTSSLEELKIMVGKANEAVQHFYVHNIGKPEVQAMIEQFGVDILNVSHDEIEEENSLYL